MQFILLSFLLENYGIADGYLDTKLLTLSCSNPSLFYFAIVNQHDWLPILVNLKAAHYYTAGDDLCSIIQFY